MKKNILRILLALISVAVLFVAFLFIEDLTYDEMKTKTEEDRKALIITWESDDQNSFWKAYEKDIHPTIEDLHKNGLISQVLPFDHNPLSYQGSALKWTNCIVLLLTKEELNPEIDHTLVSAIKKSGINDNFRSLDLSSIQKGLDMFYPKENGIAREPRMKQTIEYLFSNPDARKRYYEDQYKFSGPAMQDLHNRDKAGRFVGFELEKRIAAAENMPEWDLIHLIGFTTWQEIKAVPFFYGTWNKHAERAFGEGMTFKKKVAEWNKIRTNVKSSTKQNFTLTLGKN